MYIHIYIYMYMSVVFKNYLIDRFRHTTHVLIAVEEINVMYAQSSY